MSTTTQDAKQSSLKNYHSYLTRVPDTTTRLLGMSGKRAPKSQGTDKSKCAPRLLRHPGTELSTIWIRPPRIRRPANWDKIDEPVFSWQAMCTATLWLDFCGNANWKKDCCKKIGGRSKVGNALYCDRKNQIILVSSRRRDQDAGLQNSPAPL